jgi:hypothetical protein
VVFHPTNTISNKRLGLINKRLNRHLPQEGRQKIPVASKTLFGEFTP